MGTWLYEIVLQRKINEFLSLVEYASAVPSRKPRTPVNVEQLVVDWKAIIMGMALSHSKKEIDEWEFKLNDLLEPFLKAPVKQIREFCAQLVASLENDQSVPFFISKSVRCYVELIVEKAKDTEVIELKKEIAGRIAHAVEGDLQPQWVEAITNALMWRDPATLRKIEKAVKAGGKPKLVGKESCLFLQVDGETVML